MSAGSRRGLPCLRQIFEAAKNARQGQPSIRLGSPLSACGTGMPLRPTALASEALEMVQEAPEVGQKRNGQWTYDLPCTTGSATG